MRELETVLRTGSRAIEALSLMATCKLALATPRRRPRTSRTRSSAPATPTNRASRCATTWPRHCSRRAARPRRSKRSRRSRPRIRISATSPSASRGLADAHGCASGGTMEHLEFYELPADPFQNDADARFYYESAPQKRARLRLLRGIHQRKALSVLVGGPGLGKTTLAHMLLRELERKDYAAHYLSIPHEACSSRLVPAQRGARLRRARPRREAGPRVVDQIHAQLVAIATAKRAPVLLIDEAQLFRNREAMEEFRGLLNLLHDGRKLLSLVLFGLPELDEVLKLDEPLAQRVEIRGRDHRDGLARVAGLRLAPAAPGRRDRGGVRARRARGAVPLWRRRAARAQHAGRQLALRGVPHRDQAASTARSSRPPPSRWSGARAARGSVSAHARSFVDLRTPKAAPSVRGVVAGAARRKRQRPPTPLEPLAPMPADSRAAANRRASTVAACAGARAGAGRGGDPRGPRCVRGSSSRGEFVTSRAHDRRSTTADEPIEFGWRARTAVPPTRATSKRKSPRSPPRPRSARSRGLRLEPRRRGSQRRREARRTARPQRGASTCAASRSKSTRSRTVEAEPVVAEPAPVSEKPAPRQSVIDQDEEDFDALFEEIQLED